MKQGQRLWTREELILAINLYCKLPFGRLHRLNPEIISFSNLINRTPSSVAYKLVNFASLDPSLKARGIKGATNTSKLDKEIWNEFYNHWDILPYESEKLLAQFKHITIEQLNHIQESELPKEGKVKEQIVKIRVNQSFFRSSVLAAYNNTCCITGISQSEFLIAGHIRPWGIDEKNRLNPRNGIAINALHDKAFEIGYITITPEYNIRISPLILKQTNQQSFDFFGRFENQKIILPSRFLPDIEFLKYHNEERFKH
ncbi:putative restriction endonuclease [Chryseobacterium defluvii]|uniref:Putative restriction endonuclease n=1 Tax=Chryseobacterium defluvii TaxID=160396 RepID=A0A840KFF9_9FLAO|nr:HNH endonuclease [Chryseobacterium defluvii]MBB4805682.1 putative restriction endonuclease [Chryseobacterium defluvii]